MDLLRHLRYLALLIFILATYFSTVLARQHGIRHRHHRHKRQHASPARRPTYFVTAGGEQGADSGTWGPWSGPSPCSRSCGGGVAYQQRRCEDVSDDGQPLCTGSAKRYFSCNIQDCPEGSTDFRAEQCSVFNSVPFEGRLLQWEPYTKAPNKCELNCKPHSERYYYRHKTKVIDGTRCEDEKLDICVDGKCVPVGCDMMLGSPAREDLCRECRGDGSSCSTERNIYQMDDLQAGYNDILLIPAGATNIVVREVKPSNNYLAIRNLTGHYYLNGNWRIENPMSLRFAGTLFHYERKHFLFYASESLTALGPTTESIFVVLLYQETNPGIEYQFSISKGAGSLDPDSYSWIHGDFTPCSATCGGGYQLRNVTCARRRDLEVVEDKLCNPVLEPERNRSCGTDLCAPTWFLGEWGSCSKSCGYGGSRVRQVFCKYDIGNNLTSIVDEQRCIESTGTHPPTTEPCSEVVPCPTWFTGPWKPCNHLCGEGQHTRQVVCYRKIDGKVQVLEDSACQEEKPPDSKPCILRLCEGVDWVYSDWSGCEDKCGLTQETRTVVCSNEAGKVYPDDRCYQYRLKELIRECENQMTCEFEWFASQWSECSADCGTGVSTRKVFCGSFDGETVKKVPDAKCDPEKRYEGLKNCSGKEAKCPGQWQAGPWSACSKKCGGGVMERKVFCFIGNNSVDITKCDHNSILFASDDCNKQPCSGDQLLTVGPDADLFGDEYCEEEPDVILTTLGRGMTQWATDAGTKAEMNATATATTQLEPGAETDDGMLSDSPGTFAGSGSGEITLFDTTLPDTFSTFYSTDGLPSVFTPLTRLSSSSITRSAGTESTPSLTTVAISSDKTSTDFDEQSATTYEEITESIIGNFSFMPQSSSLASTRSSNLSLESSASSESSSVVVSDTTTADDLYTSVASMSSLSSDGTMVSLSSDISSVSRFSNLSFGTSESVSTESSSYAFTLTLNDTSATLPAENSSSTVTLTSNIILSTSDLTSSTSNVNSPTSDVDSSTPDPTSSTADLNSSTSYVNSSTSDPTSSTSDPISSTSDQTSSASDLTSSTYNVNSSTSDLNSSTSDLNSSTSDLSSSTSDLNSSTSDLSSSTSDLSSSTSDLSSSTSDPTLSSNLTSTFSSASSSLSSSSSSSSFSTSSLSSDEGSGITFDSVSALISSSPMTDTTSSEEIIVVYDHGDYDAYSDDNEGSGEKASSPKDNEMVTEKSSIAPSPLSTVPVDTISSVYTSASVDTTAPVDSTSPVDTTLPVDTTASSVRVTTEMPTVNDTSAESPSLSTTESSVMPAFLGSSTVSKGASTSTLTESSSATTLQGVYDASTTVIIGSSKITTSGLIASSITPGTEKAGVSTSSEEVTTLYTTPVEVDATVGTTAEVTEYEGESVTTPSIIQATFRTEAKTTAEVTEYEGESVTTPSIIQTTFRTEQKIKKCKKRKTTPVTCQASTFGCCFDNTTSATGPFGKGCPHPTTCVETEHGCCSDGVSPAEGPDDFGCPPSLCAETLFGCCPDGEGVAQGNDYEGCEEPTFMPVLCNATEFGCCPDEMTPASGPGNEGCFDLCEGSGDCDLCNNTVYGCCPDGITAASGENFTGCDVDLSSTTTLEPEEAGCSNSTYGCCPDGLTVAEGPYFYGCEENCTESYFGCCPDGITPAKGSQYEGCRMPCQDERYGCCSDGKTAAHGPNQEGCCLNTPHGCCPDNIIPAQGPSLEGCGCLYSPYGCCPDNTTAARGSNKDGCGCQYTSHGCCPDAYTPAAGPNYKGCPCYTYQFGCCPDGISISKGPHGEDCGCQNTQFGCCSDGKTPAAGPREEGCGCEATKYGCCPDGETPAQGDKFEECLDSPIVPAVACLEPTDRGTCRDYKVKWFFDAEYGGCSRFWYGGCEGNNNRFNSQEECKATCVEPLGRAACYLPKILGPCKEYHPTWYYDAERKQCGQFIYGGCLGNNNKFQTREECDELCVLPDTIDVCEQPQVKGPCRGNFTRWYYNYDIGQCQHFSYGGCKGNGNNFFTETACQQKCLQRGKSRAIMDICALPKDMGPCPGTILRWYYDATDETCKQFVYGGCQGNANRFRSEEECRSECRVLSDAREQDTCLLPAMVGECSNYTERWFYDSFEVRCRTFYYGGCGGNHNNFPSMEACQQRCEPGFSTPKPAQTFLTEYCFKEYDQGPCSESVIYWFYDNGDGVCKQFIYGGCQGNENRFASRQECEKTCGDAQDICTLPRVVGPCEGRQSNWYYDPASDSCQEFEYGGCQGNGNRFADQQACEERCQRSRIVTPRPTLPTPATTVYPVLPPSNICIAPVVRGPCSEELPAWYYDVSSSTCQAFIYSGCGGNANRFESEEQCERLCGPNTDKDICNIPYDVGTCSGEFPKWYYDPQTKSCQKFIYGGCTGNGNRFSSISECELICLHRDEPRPSIDNTEETAQANEIDVGTGPEKVSDQCEAAARECSQLRCPYRIDKFMDGDCTRCRCHEPCRGTQCPEGTQCAVDLFSNPETGETESRAVCRQMNKPGLCPRLTPGAGTCHKECETDADCAAELKCCLNGCGSSCISPFASPEQQILTTQPPTLAEEQTYQPWADVPPSIITSETALSVEEEGVITIRCVASGRPTPSIIWRKGRLTIMDTGSRHKLFPDGRLQITAVKRSDAGTYTCFANNGVGQPAQLDFTLDVKVPVKTNVTMTQTLFPVGSSISIPCDVDGYPIPTVTWYKDDVPLQSDDRLQISESHRLIINRANSTDTGMYRCEAVNDVDKSSSATSIVVEGIYIHPNCTDNPFFANCRLIVEARYCTHKYYARFCCKSCTIAGQLPSLGPHLQKSAFFTRSPYA